MNIFLLLLMVLYTLVIFLVLTKIRRHNKINELYDAPLKYVPLKVPMKKDIHYIFWTGGYDSTFLVVYYLMYTDINTRIQPIYLFGCVDNDVCDNQKTRQNKQKELNAMKTISENIPYNLRAKLNPLLIIDTVPIDNEIDNMAKDLYRIGHSTRPRNQYTSMAQVCKDLNITASVGIVRSDDEHDTWKNLILNNDSSIDYSYNEMKNYSLLSRFIFPIAFLSKKDMLSIAKNQGFDHILNMTWTCWFPNENGQKCGECAMCLERIID